MTDCMMFPSDGETCHRDTRRAATTGLLISNKRQLAGFGAVSMCMLEMRRAL